VERSAGCRPCAPGHFRGHSRVGTPVCVDRRFEAPCPGRSLSPPWGTFGQTIRIPYFRRTRIRSSPRKGLEFAHRYDPMAIVGSVCSQRLVLRALYTKRVPGSGPHADRCACAILDHRLRAWVFLGLESWGTPRNRTSSHSIRHKGMQDRFRDAGLLAALCDHLQARPQKDGQDLALFLDERLLSFSNVRIFQSSKPLPVFSLCS
jgi:hypothetical protein